MPDDKHIMIGDLPIRIGSMEECAHAEFMICGTVSFFADDVQTTCSACQRHIYHRPYMPLNLTKLCVYCVVQIMTEPRH